MCLHRLPHLFEKGLCRLTHTQPNAYYVLLLNADNPGDVEPDHDVPEASRRANRRCSNKRLRALGYEFKYSNYREGYDEMLIEMGLV